MKIARYQVPSIEEVEEKRINLFFEKIRTALQQGNFEKESRVVDRLLEQGFSSTDIACAAIQELRKDEARKAEPFASRPEPEEPQRPRRRDDRNSRNQSFRGRRRR